MEGSTWPDGNCGDELRAPMRTRCHLRDRSSTTITLELAAFQEYSWRAHSTEGDLAGIVILEHTFQQLINWQAGEKSKPGQTSSDERYRCKLLHELTHTGRRVLTGPCVFSSLILFIIDNFFFSLYVIQQRHSRVDLSCRGPIRRCVWFLALTCRYRLGRLPLTGWTCVAPGGQTYSVICLLSVFDRLERLGLPGLEAGRKESWGALRAYLRAPSSMHKLGTATKQPHVLLVLGGHGQWRDRIAARH
jgi:hypothetical protein